MNQLYTHADGWTSDEVFRSMRRNCEYYKKKDIELQKVTQEKTILQKELDKIKKEYEALKQELLQKIIEMNETTLTDKVTLKGWTDYILYVCRDGHKRTANEIYNIIELMETHPWSPLAKTPMATCNRSCNDLYERTKLYKEGSRPCKYYILT